MGDDKREEYGGYSFLSGVLVGILSVVGVGLLVIALSGILAGIGGNRWQKIGRSKGTEKTFPEKMKEIDLYIDNYFIFEKDQKKMEDYAAAGYLAGLNDIYSAYFTEEQFQEQIEDSDGSFVGIGVAVQQDLDTYEITAMTVYRNSPAERGGMEKGDIIVGVDGKSVQGMLLSDVVNMIRGDEDTQVKVTVLRGDRELELTMTRAKVNKETVEYRMLDGQIGYIKLSEFDNISVEQMSEAITALQDQKMKGLVLDLRDNPGGLLTSVVSIADFFLPEGNIFYYEEKSGNRTDYNSTEDQICTEPMVILVNGNSASASEVLSGSLKDHERATLMGEKTFGKGIVQSYFPLSDGSAIKITTAHYFTPNGNDIHGVGIEPNIEGKDDPATADVDELLVEACRKLQ